MADRTTRIKAKTGVHEAHGAELGADQRAVIARDLWVENANWVECFISGSLLS